jgi:hypothetical protein
VILSLCGVSLCAASPVFARAHVVAQKSTKQPLGAVYVARRLDPHHRYQVQVTASGHQPFKGYGTEQIVGVDRGRLYTLSPSLQLNGKTPQSFTVNSSGPGKVTEWILAVQVRLSAGRGLTVRFLDLGKR